MFPFFCPCCSEPPRGTLYRLSPWSFGTTKARGEGVTVMWLEDWQTEGESAAKAERKFLLLEGLRMSQHMRFCLTHGSRTPCPWQYGHPTLRHQHIMQQKQTAPVPDRVSLTIQITVEEPRLSMPIEPWPTPAEHGVHSHLPLNCDHLVMGHFLYLFSQVTLVYRMLLPLLTEKPRHENAQPLLSNGSLPSSPQQQEWTSVAALVPRLLLLVPLHTGWCWHLSSLQEEASGCKDMQGVMEDSLQVRPYYQSTSEFFPLAFHSATIQPHGKIITPSNSIRSACTDLAT